jgi:ParB family chromosome partitioning protein
MSPADEKRRGLGRGLNALFGDEEDFIGGGEAQESETSDDSGSSAGGSGRKLISISQLQPGQFQPRHTFNDTTLNELASSIRQHGLLQPILVRPKADGNFEIVAGERRWRAAQIAQLHEVPIIIRELDDDTTLEIALIENLQREDLNPIDEGRALKQLAQDFGYSNEDIADKVGKSRSYVANMIRLTELSPVVMAMVTDGKLTAGHARALLSLDEDQQEEQAKKIIALNLSVRQTEQMIGEVQGRATTSRKKNNAASASAQSGKKDVNTLALEREVSNVLGMNVSIDMKDKQEGSISISFKTLDQLDEVLHRLSHNPGRLAIKG